MYPYNCRTGTSGSLSLFQNGRQIDTTQAKDELGFAYIYQDLQPGTYQVQVSNLRYASNAVRDYTVSVYAKESV